MTLLPQEIIAGKRDGKALSREAIARFVAGMIDGGVSPAQIGAFAMAVFLNGMDDAESVALTLAMRDSGKVLDWAELDGPAIDKHSTGGIGDNVSLMLAPMLAACGAYVPMISGRGLGHSGGTLDKLDAIPGYRTVVDNATFRRAVRKAGCAIVGQTADLAPADGVLYGIRDVTGTVESLPLIVSSILSKKLAAGLDCLVLDVKTGNGAFMPELERSRELAAAMVRVANGAGVRTTAMITDMNEPLARAAGNAIEVRNALDFLTGEQRDARLFEVTLALGAELLVLAGKAGDEAAGRAALEATLDSGMAVERFAKMVATLGGPHDLVECPASYLAIAPVIRDVMAERAGVVAGIDVRAVGMTVTRLGGGRMQPSDSIDYGVGFDRLAAIGEATDPGTPLGRVHARTVAEAEMGAARLRAAYAIGESAPRHGLIVERIAAAGTD